MSQAVMNICNRKTVSATAEGGRSGQIAGLIFLLMVVSTVVCGAWMIVGWMKHDQHLTLSRLVVIGERHYTTNDDIRQAILALGAIGTFMTQDVNAIQQQIACMPWIKQVSVRKQWPDLLKIRLVEYVPVARWNDQRLLDSNGTVFSAPAEHAVDHLIPMLYGPEGSEKDVLSGYRIMNTVLTAAKFKLKTVSMSPRHSWQLTLPDDIRLELGRDDRVRRLKRFIGIHPVLLQQAIEDNQRIGYVDLRYDAGLAVGWVKAYIEPRNSNQQ